MPNYNSTLQTNNSSLEEIITQLNNLPDAPEAVTQATPAITVNQTTGLITATATQTAGYVPAGTKSATHQLAFQPAKTITPGTANKTAVAANTYVGGTVTVAGDANLKAENIVNGKTIFGITGTATTGGDDHSVEDSIITKTLTTYTNDRVTSIGVYAFCSCVLLTSVAFSQCTTIGSYAFYYCSSLTSVSFPVCTSVNANAFANCYALSFVTFQACKRIGSYAFGNCSSLTSVSFPACTSIGSYAFRDCKNLSMAIFPKCTSVNQYAFLGCSRLKMISFPACKSISMSAFCSCYRLISVYLLGSSVCSLYDTNVFMSTPIKGYSTYAGQIGSIFVPASLVDAYKTATNWAYFSNRIFAYNA